MTDVLERAKAQQAKTASETQLWIRLDLLEGLIAEIERLRAYEKRHPASAARSVADIGQRLGAGKLL